VSKKIDADLILGAEYMFGVTDNFF